MNDSDSKENGNNIDVTLLGASSKNKKNSPQRKFLIFREIELPTLILKNFLYFLLFSKWNFLTQALPPKTKKFSQGKSFFLHFLKRRLFLYFLKRKHFLYFQK